MSLTITRLKHQDDLEWCAQLLSSSEPWITLGRDTAACRGVLSHPTKEAYLLTDARERVGLLLLDMSGPFPGYIQTICLAAHARGRGLGAQAIAWAEERIFRESPNAFICVSSFNHDAQRLYERLGYSVIGTLIGFFVDEHDEILLRKTRGSWTSFRKRMALPLRE